MPFWTEEVPVASIFGQSVLKREGKKKKAKPPGASGIGTRAGLSEGINPGVTS